MTPIDWALRPLKRYADFSGRSPRAEYWWYVLAVGVAGFLFGIVDALLLHGPIYGGLGPLGLLFTVAMMVPGVAVLVRRLHDTERSGWWAVIKIPSYAVILSGYGFGGIGAKFGQLPGPTLVVAVVLALVWACVGLFIFICVVTEGTQGTNCYGPDPYGANELEEVFA
jgi:uncharacterized membrane protein YhaH (DUF805 family)